MPGGVLKQRLTWIDILKGMGILAVVAGHISEGVLREVLFTFHMPLFFFIGGLLFAQPKPPWSYFIHSLKRFIVPYSVFLILLYSREMLIFADSLPQDALAWMKLLAKPILGGQALKGWTGVFWFITCYFLVQQLFNWLLQRTEANRLRIISAGMLLLGYASFILLPQFWLPWNANVVLVALPFFHAGYEWRRIKKPHLMRIGVNIMAAAGICLAITIPAIAMDMKYAQYGIPLLSFVLALAISITLADCAHLLEQIPGVGKWLAYTGRAALIIMCLHQAVQAGMRDYLGISSVWLRFGMAVTLPIFVYWLVGRHPVARLLFLGDTPPDNNQSA